MVILNSSDDCLMLRSGEANNRLEINPATWNHGSSRGMNASKLAEGRVILGSLWLLPEGIPLGAGAAGYWKFGASFLLRKAVVIRSGRSHGNDERQDIGGSAASRSRFFSKVVTIACRYRIEE